MTQPSFNKLKLSENTIFEIIFSETNYEYTIDAKLFDNGNITLAPISQT